MTASFACQPVVGLKAASCLPSGDCLRPWRAAAGGGVAAGLESVGSALFVGLKLDFVVGLASKLPS